ncbi:dienelactone hydrolase family protein [Luteimonas yindakuii]|uniref:dienelactone hydrolase family protein n=1 Tax=Luteimonas yindakuii TaxID=2565782 RepID=UPI0010A3BEAD|nr:dienelactone hydrolase family protein [Luteimonas yindakuii]QCO67938.1 dienelactone hydrolase family protein [Luteimonas yindakuii]
MGRDIAIGSAHGSIGGWRAQSPGAPRGGLVVVQEIFGVNAHMRSVVDRYAAEGYTAIAPALFDLVQRDVELAYDDAGFSRGRELAGTLGFDRAVALVEATAGVLRDDGLAVAVVGFCWGGSVALLANTRLGLPAVSYYGARSLPFLDEPLRAPMQFHFGAHDPSIPADDIERHRNAYPDAELHVHADAGHGFNRDVDPRHFIPAAASLAHQRTLAFLRRVLPEA